MAGHMIDLHSDSVSVQAGRGYFNLAVMFDCNAVQASFFEGLPDLTLEPHSMAACFISVTSFLLSPLGASQTPNIFEASCAWSRLSETISPCDEVATRSIAESTSLATHFPLFHT